MAHEISFRIYYEDTDAGKVVYYANYLKFLERARTEFLRNLGFDQSLLAVQHSVVFAVKSLNIDYLLPARLDDLLLIKTEIPTIRRSSMVFSQKIFRDQTELCRAEVLVVCLEAESFKPCRIPDFLLDKLA